MNHQKKTYLIFILLLLSLGLLLLISLSIGDSRFSLQDPIDVISGRASSAIRLIVVKFRLPRILASLLGGASLALSGLLLQTLTRNPLADSGILGINAGAALTMAFFIAFGLLDQTGSILYLPFLATLGGLATIFLVYLAARKKHQAASPVRLIITGVALSTMLSGLTIPLVGNIDRYKVDFMLKWLSGTYTGDNWPTLAVLTPVLVLLWLLTFIRWKNLNILALNEETALALGLNLGRERLISLLLATALTGCSLLLVGNITFVGLVTGHIARRLLTAKHQWTIPAVLILGMLLLLAADTLVRFLLVGRDIPTGILVSVIGAPYFLYLMYQTQK